MKNCCAAPCSEFKAPMFDLNETTSKQSATADDEEELLTSSPQLPQLDIEQTFAPTPKLPNLVGRTFVTAWIVSLLAGSIMKTTYKNFWLAYLTHWAWLSAVAYALLSWTTMGFLYLKPLDDPKQLKGVSGVLVKTTWALFSLSLSIEVVVAVLYWVLEYDGSGVKYNSFMIHGGGVILLLIDGLLISRIPLRMKQLVFGEIFSVLYMAWNAIFSFSGLKNPYTQGPDSTQDDDAIYSAMAWKKNPTRSAILSIDDVCLDAAYLCDYEVCISLTTTTNT